LLTTQSRRAGKLTPYLNNSGYLRINLYKNGKPKHEYVHRLAALAFVPNPMNCGVVNHIDTNKGNNAVSNLEWVEQVENIRHARQHGRTARDRTVKAIDLLTGEVFEFSTIQEAATGLFGKWYALNYAIKQHGNEFCLKRYRLEVMPV
jgi:hypothetical protein